MKFSIINDISANNERRGIMRNMGTNSSSGPVPGTRLTEEYIRTIGRLAYFWAWPM